MKAEFWVGKFIYFSIKRFVFCGNIHCGLTVASYIFFVFIESINRGYLHFKSAFALLKMFSISDSFLKGKRKKCGLNGIPWLYMKPIFFKRMKYAKKYIRAVECYTR